MTRAGLMRFSERWFTLLQRLYPADFRDEMGTAVVEAYMDFAWRLARGPRRFLEWSSHAAARLWRLVSFGVVLGSAGAAALVSITSRALSEVDLRDPLAYVAVAVPLIVVALLATYTRAPRDTQRSAAGVESGVKRRVDYAGRWSAISGASMGANAGSALNAAKPANCSRTRTIAAAMPRVRFMPAKAASLLPTQMA